jgi:hypothetical protein
MPRIIIMLLAAILLLGCKRVFDQNEVEEQPVISSPADQKSDSLRLTPAKREPQKSPSDLRKKRLDTLLPIST